MTIFHISDLHFNHNRILEFSGNYREGDTVSEHNEILIDKWNSVVTKRDVVYIHGDVFFGAKVSGIELVSRLKGIKTLIMGNHDRSAKNYLSVFNNVHGFIKFKGFWLSHAPVHSSELRGMKNIHGHLHSDIVRTGYGDPDDRYVNVCVEQCNGFPVAFEDIVSGKYKSRSI